MAVANGTQSAYMHTRYLMGAICLPSQFSFIRLSKKLRIEEANLLVE
jgi:hypothetical protein